MKLMYLSLLFISCNATWALPYIPESDDTVIATWKTIPNSDQSRMIIDNPTLDQMIHDKTKSGQLLNEKALIAEAEKDLNLSNLVGKSHYYELAKKKLTPIYEKSNTPKFWTLWARIQQKDHQFDAAIASLHKALALDDKNINAHLLMARIYAIRNQQQKAKSACLKLIETAAMLTAQVCLLDVMRDQGNLNKNYQQLSELLNNQSMGDKHRSWIISILAEMAIDLGNYDEAEHWLESDPENQNLTYLIQWAMTKIELNKAKEVMTKFSKIAQVNPDVEDVIVLYLAMAENNRHHAEQTENSTKNIFNEQNRSWNEKIRKRIELRELRKDKHHPNEMALYYLTIDYNPKRALYWAQENWKEVQEYKDQVLLNIAQKAAKSNQK